MKYILGGGISGLIFAYFNPEYTIISNNVGGQMGSSFQLGPRYLHKTINSEFLLSELNIPYKERQITVGYLDDNKWIQDPNIEFRKKYFLKSRNTKSLEGFDSSVMNSNNDSFSVLDVDFHTLIKKLSMKINNFKKGNIISIDNESRYIKIEEENKQEVISYDHIVSTIPLSLFSLILENDDNIKQNQYLSYSMTYCLVRDDGEFNILNYDFVYDIRSISKWHRMTKDPSGIVLDFFGALNKDELKQSVGHRYYDHKILLNSQIVSNEEELKMKNVKFIGRYGTWNRLWKTEKVIDEAIKWKKDDIKLAMLLLSGRGCHDCEKGMKFTIKFENEALNDYKCMIEEGTPEKSICKYWSSS